MRMDEAVAEARRLAAKKMIPPRFILRATIAQMQQFIATPPATNAFVTAFDQRLAASKAVSDARRQALRTQVEKTVATLIYPAWKRGIDVLQPLAKHANDDAGLWRFANGAEAYAYTLRRYTTTNLTADQIHEIGLARVADLEKQMDDVFRRVGRTQGSVKDRIAQLKQEQAYPLTEDGRRQIIADANAILSDARTRAAAQFDRMPNAPVEVRPFPRFREANAAANYTAPPADGSRPGIVQVPLRPERMTKFGLRTLIYHEGVPGHHFQIALEGENPTRAVLPPCPRLRRHLCVERGMGTVRGKAGGRVGLVPGRSDWPARSARQRTVSRAPARRRHGDPRQTLDAAAGHRLWHRSQRGRALRGEPRSGVLVYGRRAEAARASRQGEEGARRRVQDPRVPQRRAPGPAPFRSSSSKQSSRRI